MAERLGFETDRAAVLGGPYSQAIIHNGLIYLSGQGPIDTETNMAVPGTIEVETDLTMKNIRIILEDAGSSLHKILKVTVYLLDIREYGRFNEAYERHFEKSFPARSCIQAAKLPFGVRIEIDAIAYI